MFIQVRAGGDYGPLLGTYCGRNQTIQDITNDGPIYIKFVSDFSVTGRGFRLLMGGTRVVTPALDPEICISTWSCKLLPSFYGI